MSTGEDKTTEPVPKLEEVITSKIEQIQPETTMPAQENLSKEAYSSKVKYLRVMILHSLYLWLK